MAKTRRSARESARSSAGATAHAGTTPTRQSPSEFELCFERMKPRFEELDPDSLLAMTHDVPSMVATVLGAVVNIRSLRDAIGTLPETDLVCVDELEDCARALIHANMLYQLAIKPTESLASMAEKAAQLRSTLYSDAVALENRELLGGDELSSYRGTPGYKIMAADLVLLAGLLRRAWPSIAGKTAIREADLVDANTVANALLTAVGVRERSPALVAEAAQTRLAAYNLLLRRYDDVRRAIGYLRWREDDADDFAPSLYAGRRNGNHRKRAEEDAPEPPPPAEDAEGASHEPAGAASAASGAKPVAPTGTAE